MTDTTNSVYDLLPEEDLEALRWMRGQGGLDVVRMHAELYQQLKEECSGYRDLAREYEKRLMPDGMEWPRYEDGELVKLGDSTIDDDIPEWHEIDTIIFQRTGSGYTVEIENNRGVSQLYEPGERVKRLTGAVLDSNDAPLNEGDTVWHEDGTELKVIGFGNGQDGETLVKVERISGPTNWSECLNLSLTHKRPDPWKCLEDKAYEIDFAWASEYGYDEDEVTQVRDLVHEAKKLAGCDAK